MIVQACLNGARPADFHPALPTSPASLAADAAACIAAGAAEIHLHPRDDEGRETLSPDTIDRTIAAVRRSCPGTAIGVSTADWIERSLKRTLAAIAGWRELPDYASVNLSEPGAPTVMTGLRQRGLGTEAGLSSLADARRLLDLRPSIRPCRILIEIEEQDPRAACDLADRIETTLSEAGLHCPRLLHGGDAAMWDCVTHAFERRLSTRVGRGGGGPRPPRARASGPPARVNAALVEASIALRAQVGTA